MSTGLIFDVGKKMASLLPPFHYSTASRTTVLREQEGREGLLGKIAIFICERCDMRGDRQRQRRLFGQHGAKIKGRGEGGREGGGEYQIYTDSGKRK